MNELNNTQPSPYRKITANYCVFHQVLFSKVAKQLFNHSMETGNNRLKDKVMPLIRQIIRLQETGFVLDFQKIGNSLICLQTGAELDIVTIKVISIDHLDSNNGEKQYLCALESDECTRGLLLTDFNLFDHETDNN